MNNYEKIKKMDIDEMANMLRLCANWDRKQKCKAEKLDENFYLNWLKSDSMSRIEE